MAKAAAPMIAFLIFHCQNGWILDLAQKYLGQQQVKGCDRPWNKLFASAHFTYPKTDRYLGAQSSKPCCMVLRSTSYKLFQVLSWVVPVGRHHSVVGFFDILRLRHVWFVSRKIQYNLPSCSAVVESWRVSWGEESNLNVFSIKRKQWKLLTTLATPVSSSSFATLGLFHAKYTAAQATKDERKFNMQYSCNIRSV